jgi:uncharacterized protein YbbC (DUF1343 family)
MTVKSNPSWKDRFVTARIFEILIPKISMRSIIEVYNDYNPKSEFFKAIFPKLAGNNVLQKQIAEGKTAKEIRQSWKKDLDEFKIKRNKYLLYP